MHEKIREGFDVFLHDGEKSFGAVRRIRKDAIVVYVENSGDFEIPLNAVKDAEAEKVILGFRQAWTRNCVDAIRRAHTGEDPRIP